MESLIEDWDKGRRWRFPSWATADKFDQLIAVAHCQLILNKGISKQTKDFYRQMDSTKPTWLDSTVTEVIQHLSVSAYRYTG